MALMQGQVTLVTGAASGIGRATAVEMAEEGAAAIVLVDVDSGGLAETGNLVAEHGAEPAQVVADVTDETEVAAAVATAVDRFGRLDSAFNNAGTSGAWAPIAEYPVDDWHRVLALNLTSVFFCLRHEIPAMRASGGGAIVNTSSGAGIVGNAGQAAYVASKHGVLGLTRTAAREVAADGIRVNAVCPGTTRTPMLESFMGGDPAIEEKMARVSPLKRLGTPEEIARAVVWLCSDAASYVVGHSLVIDGGAIGR